jgi:hypothetical protein
MTGNRKKRRHIDKELGKTLDSLRNMFNSVDGCRVKGVSNVKDGKVEVLLEIDYGKRVKENGKTDTSV